jgi:hypothetical protein
MLVREVDTEDIDDDLDKRDTSEKVDSGLDPMDDPVDMVDGLRLYAVRVTVGQDSTLATLAAGVYERGGGVGLGVGIA